MEIKSAKFIISVADGGKIPDYNSMEIAVAGKSNVGKSSFINFMTNHGKLAKTSSEPGRTRLLNYFEINNGEFYFVDLPGYGYARVAQTEKEKWGPMIEGYIQNSGRLKNVFVLLDIRHDPTKDDIMLINYLFHYNIPITIIATKADKLSRAQQQKAVKNLADKVCVGTSDVLTVSSLTKSGKQAILDRIQQILEN